MGNQCKRKKEYMGYPLKNRKNIWEIHLFSLQSSQGIWGGGDTFLLFCSTQQNKTLPEAQRTQGIASLT